MIFVCVCGCGLDAMTITLTIICEPGPARYLGGCHFSEIAIYLDNTESEEEKGESSY
jgi:hypothetical protein